MERKILNEIGFENLITTSIYEFIKTYFYDFRYNNKIHIKEMNLEEHTQNFENLAVYFAKLSCYFDEFYKYNNSLKAITCVVACFDVYRNTGKLNENKKGLSFFRDWVLFLISESEYPYPLINEVYGNLLNVHVNYENIPLISCNLNKYHKD